MNLVRNRINFKISKISKNIPRMLFLHICLQFDLQGIAACAAWCLELRECESVSNWIMTVIQLFFQSNQKRSVKRKYFGRCDKILWCNQSKNYKLLCTLFKSRVKENHQQYHVRLSVWVWYHQIGAIVVLFSSG